MSIRNRINRFLKERAKENRRKAARRAGITAEFMAETRKKSTATRRKYMKLRNHMTDSRGLDGTMR